MIERMKKAIRKFLGMINSGEIKSAKYTYLKEIQRLRDIINTKPNHQTNGAKSPKASR